MCHGLGDWRPGLVEATERMSIMVSYTRCGFVWIQNRPFTLTVEHDDRHAVR